MIEPDIKQVSNNPLVYALLKEYDVINSKIEQFLKAQPSMFGAGVIVNLGLLGAFSDGQSTAPQPVDSLHFIIIVALPFFTLFYANIIAYHYMRTMTLQGYKKYLEQRINEALGAKYFNYSVVGMGTEKRNFFQLSFLIGILIMILASVIVPLYFFSENASKLTYEQNVYLEWVKVIFFIFFILSIISGIQLRGAFGRSFKKSEAEWHSELD